MADTPNAPPALSTPDTRIFEAPTPITTAETANRSSESELYTTYEIERTVREIRKGRWKRIALQFPDDMLVDAPRVFEALSRGLKAKKKSQAIRKPQKEIVDGASQPIQGSEDADKIHQRVQDLDLAADGEDDAKVAEKLYILGDTSYGSCCVDEIAAEHVDADVVVHYGRSCLSPTSRLPVIYVFTVQKLSLDPVVQAFKNVFPDRKERVILMADVTHVSHVPSLGTALTDDGYSCIYQTSVVNSPASPIPNRSVPEMIRTGEHGLREYCLFHISEPPASLLLTLSSRLSSIYFYPTNAQSPVVSSSSLKASTSLALRRRYALLTSLATVPIFGILINTLSVKNYLHIVDHVKGQIAAAGKKSYTFVVGKVNAAKIANFSEVGGWVIIGCWESSLVENAEFWKPVITPFELELSLQGDGERIWSGEWRSDFNDLLQSGSIGKRSTGAQADGEDASFDGRNDDADGDHDIDSEPESLPPEFDLRTGRYVSNSRPMQIVDSPSATTRSVQAVPKGADSLMKKTPNGLLAINGEASPGAEFFHSKRSWKGLGSDFEIAYDDSSKGAASIEQGRSGIASGYVAGGRSDKR
ncbi:MAG: Diphthamide biosynthesis protein 2 [Sclerophora amabilis]|nr:MAG: Diphthamide biosynthesis protein 2 [Sclerophora amabilis]